MKKIILLTAIVVATVLPLDAAVIVVRPDESMIRTAPAILTGTVVEVYPRHGVHGDIETVTRILVDETIKGNVPAGEILDLVQFGGHLDGRFQAQSGAPKYEVGTRYLVFLDRNGSGSWTTFDLALGQFRFVVRDGKQLLVRDMSEVVGWLESGEVFHDVDRSAPQFLALTRSVVKTALSQSGVLDAKLHPAPMALDFDLKTVSQNAVGSWAGAESAMNDSVSATPAGGDAMNLDDCESRTIADDPHAAIPGTFNGNGVVATAFYGCGSPCGSCASSIKNGETYISIDTMDVVVNDGVSSGTIAAGNFLSVMVHEFGHTWGFRHSNNDGSCPPPLPCDSSAIMNAILVGGLNGGLQDWDRDAANEVYGDGSREPTHTGVQYVGPLGGMPARRPSGTSWRISVAACVPPSVTSATATPSTITSGSSATLNATATGSPTLSFQWYRGNPTDTSNPAGAAGASISVSPTVTTTYWVRVTGQCAPPSDSGPVTVTVQACQPTTSVTASANPASISPGASSVLTATANGTNPQYQWYTGDPPGQILSGATAAQITVSGFDSTTKFFAKATNACGGPINSNVVTVTVACQNVQITAAFASPSSITAGATTTLRVNAFGTNLTYQWFFGTKGNTSSPVPAATGFQFSANPTQTTSFWVRVNGECGGPVDSDTIIVTVVAQCVNPSGAVATGNPLTIPPGGTTNLAATANGTGLTFQWFIGAPPNGSAISGATNPTLAQQPAATTTYFVRVSGQCGSPIDSNPVTVTVSAACINPSIATQPANKSILAGTTATLTVGGAGTEPLHYQWFEGATGDTSKPKGTDSANFTTAPLMKRTQFWVRVSGNCGQPVFSNTATVEVKAGRPRPVKH